MADALLTADELAERLRVQPGTVREWARSGRIPAVRLSPKVVRYDLAAVIAAFDDPPLADRRGRQEVQR